MIVFLIVLASVLWVAIGATGLTLNWLRHFGKVTVGEFCGHIFLGGMLGLLGFIIFGIPWGKGIGGKVIFRSRK